MSSSEGTFFNILLACWRSSKLLWGWVYTKTSLWNKGNNRNSFLFPISSHLCTDDEILNWQFVFGSSLLLFHYYVKMVLTIRFRFKVDYCFTIKSYDSLVHYLIFIFLLKPSAFFNRTNIILYVTTSMSRRLIILFKYKKKCI